MRANTGVTAACAVALAGMLAKWMSTPAAPAGSAGAPADVVVE